MGGDLPARGSLAPVLAFGDSSLNNVIPMILFGALGYREECQGINIEPKENISPGYKPPLLAELFSALENGSVSGYFAEECFFIDVSVIVSCVRCKKCSKRRVEFCRRGSSEEGEACEPQALIV